MNHKQQKERASLTSGNMEFLKIPASLLSSIKKWFAENQQKGKNKRQNLKHNLRSDNTYEKTQHRNQRDFYTEHGS